MIGAPDVEAAILHAKRDPALHAAAQLRWQQQSNALFLPHKTELSASAAGSCVLEKWAHLHDALDLPRDVTQEVVKMDGGTMYGAWLAALFAVGYADRYAGATVAVEVEGEHDGIPGHVEIVIDDDEPRGEANTRWMVEIKTSFWGGVVTPQPPFGHSKAFHVIQAAKEALIVGAPGFSVFNVYPAATKKGGAPARHFIQDDFTTADWVAAVQDEYRRLEAARGPNAPIGDAAEAWRCVSCRFSGCAKNRNPQNPNLPLPMAKAV